MRTETDVKKCFWLGQKTAFHLSFSESQRRVIKSKEHSTFYSATEILLCYFGNNLEFSQINVYVLIQIWSNF